MQEKDKEFVSREGSLAEDEEPTAPLLADVQRLARFIGPHRQWIILGILFATIDAVATTVQSTLVGEIVDSFSGKLSSDAFGEFKVLLTSLTICYIVEAIFAFSVAFCFKTAGSYSQDNACF